MVAAVPGDCANRLVDAQKTTIGRNFGNTDGRVFISRGESLLLLEREQARPFERSACPLALRNVEKAVNRSDDLASGHHSARAETSTPRQNFSANSR